MQDITDLERRLTAALDRIGRGLPGLGPLTEPEPESAGDPDLPDAATLLADLEAERDVTRQLEARIAAIHAKEDAKIAAIAGERDRAVALAEALEAERGRLRQVNEALRNASQALREAQADGMADAHLINEVALTELDALRSLRQADRAEIDRILAALEPVLEDATQTEAEHHA